jgi:hypothetical protein
MKAGVLAGLASGHVHPALGGAGTGASLVNNDNVVNSHRNNRSEVRKTREFGVGQPIHGLRQQQNVLGRAALQQIRE